MDGRIRCEYAVITSACGRGYFRIRKEKVADSKISGYVWTGPQLQMKNSENYLPVCSKSKVMIRYIENTNSRYFNYFCFPTALFW